MHTSTLCARHLGYPIYLVPGDQWIDKVRDAASRPGDAANTKAVKLMGLWTSTALAAQARPNKEALGMPRLDTQVTESESSALKRCEPTNEADVNKWFSYWMNHGLFVAS